MSAPPGKTIKKKERKLPDFGHREDSLEETSARGVVEQYLDKYPERLGNLLRRMKSKEKRAAAMQSIDSKDMVRPTQNYSFNLLPDDTVAFLIFHDSSADMDYALLRVSEIPDPLGSVLCHWLAKWMEKHDTAAKRVNKLEHDGSVKCEVDEEVSEFEDAIQQYVDDLELEHGDDKEEDEEEEDEEFNTDEKLDEVRDTIQQWLLGAEWVKKEEPEKFTSYMKGPKITVRFDVN